MFSSLVWSHSSCKCPCLFRFVVFQYFDSYDVSYFMLIRVFVILSFSVTVFNNVSSLKYEWLAFATIECSYRYWMKKEILATQETWTIIWIRRKKNYVNWHAGLLTEQPTNRLWVSWPKEWLTERLLTQKTN